MPTKFENMTLPEVHVRTASEGPVQRGKPLYFNRPWSQLHDEMVDAEVKRIGDLPESRIQALRTATGTPD